MKKTAIAALIILLVGAGMALAGDDTRWLNVHVTETSSNTNVEVHLPLNLVLNIMEGIKVDSFDAGKIDLDLGEAEIDWPQVFGALKDAPDGKFVTVASDDADVEVKKEQGMMLVHVVAKEGGHEKVDVRIPMELMDALDVDEHNRIDVKALLTSLDRLPQGELVRVDADDANVRVWVE
jgi:hypothetical protein